MRRVRKALAAGAVVAITVVAAAAPAYSAEAVFLDAEGDGIGGMDIKGLQLKSDGIYLEVGTVLDQTPILSGDSVAWYLDTDNIATTGEPVFGGADWRGSYRRLTSGGLGGGLSPWDTASGTFNFDPSAYPPSFYAHSNSTVIVWRAALSELGVPACGTVRVRTVAQYAGTFDWAPERGHFVFNVCSGEPAPAPAPPAPAPTPPGRTPADPDRIDRTPPRIASASLGKRLLVAGASTFLKVRVNETGRAHVRVERKTKAGWRRTGRAISRKVVQGITVRVPVNRSLLGPRPLAGSYRLVVTVKDSSGNQAGPRRVPLRVIST